VYGNSITAMLPIFSGNIADAEDSNVEYNQQVSE